MEQTASTTEGLSLTTNTFNCDLKIHISTQPIYTYLLAQPLDSVATADFVHLTAVYVAATIVIITIIAAICHAYVLLQLQSFCLDKHDPDQHQLQATVHIIRLYIPFTQIASMWPLPLEACCPLQQILWPGWLTEKFITYVIMSAQQCSIWEISSVDKRQKVTSAFSNYGTFTSG